MNVCVIIDRNKHGPFLQEPPTEDMQPIHDWIKKQGGKLVYSTGGKFSEEFSGKARTRLDVYRQANRAKLIPYKEVEKKLNELDMDLMKSDDPHIIALALAANVNLLYTADRNLIDDFKNTLIMGTGNKGKIYSSAKNKSLLNRDTCP